MLIPGSLYVYNKHDLYFVDKGQPFFVYSIRFVRPYYMVQLLVGTKLWNVPMNEYFMKDLKKYNV